MRGFLIFILVIGATGSLAGSALNNPASGMGAGHHMENLYAAPVLLLSGVVLSVGVLVSAMIPQKEI